MSPPESEVSTTCSQFELDENQAENEEENEEEAEGKQGDAGEYEDFQTDPFSNHEPEGASDDEKKEEEIEEDKGEDGEFPLVWNASLV